MPERPYMTEGEHRLIGAVQHAQSEPVTVDPGTEKGAEMILIRLRDRFGCTWNLGAVANSVATCDDHGFEPTGLQLLDAQSGPLVIEKLQVVELA